MRAQSSDTAKASPGATPAGMLDPSAPTPLYHQLYLVLREKIARGEFAADETLPGEQTLARRFDVSRITVKRALNELALNGLVSRHRGRGTLVTKRGAIPVVKGSFDTLIESLRVMGLETEVRLVEVVDTPASESVARMLAVPPGQPVQRAVRVRSLQGEPFSHLVTYVPIEIARRYSIEDLASKPLLTLLERAGAPAFEAEQWISAAAAEPSVASALEVSVGAPLLRIERIMLGEAGDRVQLIHAHYRPDRFQYHVKTRRRRTEAAAHWREEG